MASRTIDRFLMSFGVAAIFAAAGLMIWNSGVATGGGAAVTPALFSESLTLAQANQRAAAEGKPVFVVVSAEWCGPCKSYKKSTLSDARVDQAVRSKAIPVLLDADRDRADLEPLGVMSIPVTILLRDGKEVSRLSGRATGDEVIGWLERTSSR